MLVLTCLVRRRLQSAWSSGSPQSISYLMGSWRIGFWQMRPKSRRSGIIRTLVTVMLWSSVGVEKKQTCNKFIFNFWENFRTKSSLMCPKAGWLLKKLPEPQNPYNVPMLSSRKDLLNADLISLVLQSKVERNFDFLSYFYSVYAGDKVPPMVWIKACWVWGVKCLEGSRTIGQDSFYNIARLYGLFDSGTRKKVQKATASFLKKKTWLWACFLREIYQSCTEMNFWTLATRYRTGRVTKLDFAELCASMAWPWRIGPRVQGAIWDYVMPSSTNFRFYGWINRSKKVMMLKELIRSVAKGTRVQGLISTHQRLYGHTVQEDTKVPMWTRFLMPKYHKPLRSMRLDCLIFSENILWTHDEKPLNNNCHKSSLPWNHLEQPIVRRKWS